VNANEQQICMHWKQSKTGQVENDPRDTDIIDGRAHKVSHQWPAQVHRIHQPMKLQSSSIICKYANLLTIPYCKKRINI
jgi:hypothetical protein